MSPSVIEQNLCVDVRNTYLGCQCITKGCEEGLVQGSLVNYDSRISSVSSTHESSGYA